MRHGFSRGSVLIVVLWVCLGLVSLTLLFGHSMLMNYRGVDDGVAGSQAEAAIEGAARYVETILMNVETPGLFPDPDSYESEAVSVGEAFFWFLGRSQDMGNGTTRVYGLTDEASKLNLNTATPEMLEALPGMTPDLAAAIVDWRDTDEDVTPGGAESSYYLSQSPAYACKNAPFESVEELALVAGVDSTLLYGEDANLNGVLDPNENDGNKTLPADNADGKLDPGLLEYVTVFSREPNKQSDGSARVNVAAPSPELMTLLQQTFGDSRASEIAQRVGSAPCRSTLEYYVRSGMTQDEFTQISDAISVSTAPFLIGRVNVNTASETVLSCIPGIGPDKASTLVAARLSRGQQDTGVAWVADTLGPEGAVQAGPYLTGRSFQVSADVAAVGRHGRGYRRVWLVIDNSTETPRIIYRRDRAALGWALGDETRQSLATGKEVR